jgi:hypothetical protein
MAKGTAPRERRAVCLCGLASSAKVDGVQGGTLFRATAGVGLGVLGGLLLLVACGARTGLVETEPTDAGPELDSNRDGVDAPRESALDVGAEGKGEGDAPFDAPFDIPDDVPVPSDCPDAAATLVYVITMDNKLYSFYPPTFAFSFIGDVACPGTTTDSTFSMAVDRHGIAYVLFDAGNIFRVDTATAACTTLPYVPGQSGFRYFGMGFATNGAGPSETLYIQGDSYYDPDSGEAPGLASLDTTDWTVTPIGSATPALAGGELTGTGGGDLFAFFYYPTDTSGSRLGQLDKATGQLTASAFLPDVTIDNNSFAVAFWGGDFYFFTDGTATRYSPSTGATQIVANLGDDIVGAGVSTCAPE